MALRGICRLLGMLGGTVCVALQGFCRLLGVLGLVCWQGRQLRGCSCGWLERACSLLCRGWRGLSSGT